MTENLAPRVRRSLTALQDDYDRGNKKPLEDLMRAWKGVKELPTSDQRSFFVLGGYHGEPFRGAGWGSSAWWGGYCHHGNVLFPVWHRMYLMQIEDALRSIPGCADVTLPFWDETANDSLTRGLPWALTRDTFDLDGRTIPNPLRSYVFPLSIVDHIDSDKSLYTKARGYETVRYPYSGLVGTPEAREATRVHNARWTYPQAVDVLNRNVAQWLTQTIVIGGKTVSTGVHQMFRDCLDAPNYTVFSNTSSAAQWNDNAARPAVALEQPHNKIHLAIGGFDVPGQGDFSLIPGANGDMGENDTAGLDPVFYFHHCFIDRMFWLWQQRHGATDHLEVIPGYPGTNSVDGQGPTPGVPGNAWLSMDSPLEPFRRPSGAYYTGRDAFNIERQLGYRYDVGSLEEHAAPVAAADAAAPDDADADDTGAPKVHVRGVNRGTIRGSFIIAAYARVDGERKLIGSEAVLSRWHVEGCANCLTHLRSSAVFPLHGLDADGVGEEAVEVEVVTRDGLLGGRAHGPRTLAAATSAEPPPFHVEVR